MAYYEHVKDNKYKLVTRDPRVVGRRKRITKTIEVPPEIARTKLKKEQWLAAKALEFEEQVQSGEILRSDRMTFEQFIPKWLEGYARQNMGGYTIRNTMSIINAYLLPAFGHVRLDQIKTIHLVTFFANLKRKDGQPMATNTKLNVYKAAKSIFDAAHQWSLIAQNPMDGVQRPSQSKKEKKAIRDKKKNYTIEETYKVLEALHSLPVKWRLYFTGNILGGFRRGELLAVEWSDIDYDNGCIWIDKQITFDEDGTVIEGEVKTEESEDWVAMPRWYMDELKAFELEWKKEKLQCREWLGGDKQYIFHSGQGKPYYPSTATGTWTKFLRRNGLPHIPLHGLRHTAGNILRDMGADLKTIQERLRHSKLSTTADIYTHKNQNFNRSAADKLEVLNPKMQKFAPSSAPKAK